MVQWLRHYASIVGGAGSIPGQGTKIPHATLCGKKKNRKQKTKTQETKKQNKKRKSYIYNTLSSPSHSL